MSRRILKCVSVDVRNLGRTNNKIYTKLISVLPIERMKHSLRLKLEYFIVIFNGGYYLVLLPNPGAVLTG